MTIDELYLAFQGPINGVIKSQQDLYNGIHPILQTLVDYQIQELQAIQLIATELGDSKVTLDQVKDIVQKASASKLKTELKTLLGM